MATFHICLQGQCYCIVKLLTWFSNDRRPLRGWAWAASGPQTTIWIAYQLLKMWMGVFLQAYLTCDTNKNKWIWSVALSSRLFVQRALHSGLGNQWIDSGTEETWCSLIEVLHHQGQPRAEIEDAEGKCIRIISRRWSDGAPRHLRICILESHKSSRKSQEARTLLHHRWNLYQRNNLHI